MKKNDKVTPQKVMEILEKHGTKVTLEEAKIILGFMRKLVNLAVNQLLNK